MNTRAIGKPRFIDPSLIEIGDDISVEHKIDKGVITTLRGIVGKQIYGGPTGNTHYLLTEEGSTLLAWDPNKKANVRITLYGRAEYPSETLFSEMEVAS